jgi:hypothetical protein
MRLIKLLKALNKISSFKRLTKRGFKAPFLCLAFLIVKVLGIKNPAKPEACGVLDKSKPVLDRLKAYKL